MVTVTMPRDQVDIACAVLLMEAQRLATDGDAGAVRTLFRETLPPLLAGASPDVCAEALAAEMELLPLTGPSQLE